MGAVRVIARVIPDEPEKFEDMKSAIKALNPENYEIEDIGFGVKAIKLVKIIPEEDGAMPKFEEELEKARHVGNSEILAVDRM